MNDHKSLKEAELLEQAGAGDSIAMGQLLDSHRSRLERIVQLRLDRRVQSRINASDVLQETYIEAANRLREYLNKRDVPFFVWLRFLAQQRLSQLHRHHLGRKVRDANNELRIDQLGASSSEGTFQLIGQLSSPSTSLQRFELQKRLNDVLAGMDRPDHEILVLRHFEQLTNLECAEVLKISPTAASNRYIRALERLREKLSGDEEFSPA